MTENLATSRLLSAAALSFLPYALPPLIRGKPHVVACLLEFAGLDPWGEVARGYMVEVPGGYEILLPASAIGIAILGQSSLLILLLRILQWRGLLRKAVGVALANLAFILMFTIGVSLVLPGALRVSEPLLVRPRRPLPERIDWPVEWVQSGYEIAQFVHTPPHGLLARNGELWVRNRSSGHMGLMQLKGCSVSETAFREDDLLVSRFYATVEGRAIFVKSEDRGNPEQWWYVKGTQAQAVKVPRPNSAVDDWPILSDDGRWVLWVTATTPGHHRVVMQSMESPETKTISSGELTTDRLRILGYDAGRGELVIARHNYEQAVGIRASDGVRMWGPVEIPGKLQRDSVVSRVLRTQGGWVTWTSLTTPHIVHWNVREVNLWHQVQDGTHINSVDVSPDGSLIAIGTDGDFAGSTMESAAYVLRTGTGEEVFREYFARRAWVSVAFLGNDRFAYSARATDLLIPGAAIKVRRIAR